ncbi:MAG: integration host factor subunit beta [Candidatus Omnitrophica bacterium]|nr:integration host factor subunit beta [Candidatus Omnitrophota bacterium]
MTKRDLAVNIAQKTGITQSLIQKVVDALLNEITETLAQGQGIELRNFGVFKIKNRKERIGRNPRTGETVSIPPKKIVYFKVGKILKERVK